MTDLWLTNLHQHDMLTVILAGLSLLAVLAGFVILHNTRTRIDRIIRSLFLVTVMALWLIVLAGSALMVIVGVSG
jgi:hypothetical protein